MEDDIYEMSLRLGLANIIPVPEYWLRSRRLQEAESGWKFTKDIRYTMDSFSADYEDSSECTWETEEGWGMVAAGEW
jgi:hypothetical protein